jgi:hypothetical protein
MGCVVPNHKELMGVLRQAGTPMEEFIDALE